MFILDAIVFAIVMIVFIYLARKQKRKKFNVLYDWEEPKARARPKLDKHETECRRIFEDIFGVRFEKVRPDWLRIPFSETGDPLPPEKFTKKHNAELDGFNPNISTPIGRGVAFEFDGIQHRVFTPRFHRSKAEFYHQVRKDIFKTRVCAERGVVLIRIPDTVKWGDMRRFIVAELEKRGVIPGRDEAGTGNLYA